MGCESNSTIMTKLALRFLYSSSCMMSEVLFLVLLCSPEGNLSC